MVNASAGITSVGGTGTGQGAAVEWVCRDRARKRPSGRQAGHRASLDAMGGQRQSQSLGRPYSAARAQSSDEGLSTLAPDAGDLG